MDPNKRYATSGKALAVGRRGKTVFKIKPIITRRLRGFKADLVHTGLRGPAETATEF